MVVIKYCANRKHSYHCTFNFSATLVLLISLSMFSIYENKEELYLLCYFHIFGAYYVYKISIYKQQT